MTIKNVAASVRARLQSHARGTKRPFQEVLQYYAMERFLYRLSRSAHRERFILKGALMLRVWDAPVSRPTRDVDLLGHVDNAVENLVQIVRELCDVEVEADGLRFDPASVSGAKTKEDADYEGVRIRFVGFLENSQVPMQIDVGFGDAVVPAPTEVEYPVILDLPAPRLRAYSRESVIAEKLQAMVFLGSLNSRMKDFYDIWLLARQFDFDGPTLSAAVKATFSRRATAIDAQPVAFTPEFFDGDTAKRQWAAFINKANLIEAPTDFSEVVGFIAAFLVPVLEAAGAGGEPTRYWRAPGPWNAAG